MACNEPIFGCQCVCWFRVSLVWVQISAFSLSCWETLGQFPSLYVQDFLAKILLLRAGVIVKIRNNAKLPIQCTADEKWCLLLPQSGRGHHLRICLEKLGALSTMFTHGSETFVLTCF